MVFLVLIAAAIIIGYRFIQANKIEFEEEQISKAKQQNFTSTENKIEEKQNTAKAKEPAVEKPKVIPITLKNIIV